MLESVIGYAAPHLNVQASSTIKAACGTAAFRTRDDPKHDAGHSSAFSFPPALCSSRKENRDVGTTEDHFVCRAGDRCRWLHCAGCCTGAGKQDHLAYFAARRQFDAVQDPAAGGAGDQEPARTESVPAGVPVRLAVCRQDQVESRGLERKYVDHLLDGEGTTLRSRLDLSEYSGVFDRRGDGRELSR
ncbi:hypothetical protein Smlt2793 [Stenotrophomonas maltophilia K279a]|uniref:Uncharacterized protein n=1 Tax=Stenotrophomonas maltophilia (strain K279a) TaxID=522373 RepID=B2FUN1_STRMK|nr:hypothetical protein Smlt2793 [Stenotrophomonas maltophilia K279a]